MPIKINGKEHLNGGEAAKYLAKRWDIPSYSTTAFRMLRHRLHLEPDISLPPNTTLWKPSTLDKIARPDRRKPRRKKQIKDAETRVSEKAENTNGH